MNLKPDPNFKLIIKQIIYYFLNYLLKLSVNLMIGKKHLFHTSRYNDVMISHYGLPALVDLMTCMWKQDPVGRPQAVDLSRQMNDITFQLLFGKTSLESADRKPRLFCDVPQTKEVWVVMEDMKGGCLSVFFRSTDCLWKEGFRKLETGPWF